MRLRDLTPLLRCQRGVALPMAMLTLMILSALMIAFSMLAASEPVLANNQLQVAQARSVAESGVERAIWALNNPADPNGIPNPLVTPAAPYDGSTTTAVMQNGVQIGVFTVSVTNGTLPNERVIVATGWTPTNTGAGPKVKQKVQVSVMQFLFSALPPPGALTVRGEVNASGNTLIDSRSDTSCGNKAGTYTQGSTETGGSAAVYGADGNNTQNQSTDVVQNVPDSNFDAFTLKNADLNALKRLAKARGTYYQGTVLFNSGNQMPNGVIFIDTVSGNNIDVSGTTPSSDFASVTIHGNAPASADGIFHGLLIVNGTLTINGNFKMYGLAYATNDFTYVGTGTGEIDGAVVSRNIRDTSSTTIDTNTGGNATIRYNCSYVKNGGGQIPPGFLPEKGTYKEISG